MTDIIIAAVLGGMAGSFLTIFFLAAIVAND